MTEWKRVNFLLPCIAVAGFAMFSGCAEKSGTESSTESSSVDESTDLGESTELGEPAKTVELSDEDKALVAAQVFCPVGDELGSMGTPIKVMHEDKAVFLCCEGCRDSFLKEPEKYLAKLAEKQKAATGESEKKVEFTEEPATEKEAS